MDLRQQEEFNERAHALTMKILEQSGRLFEETRQITENPWRWRLMVGIPTTIALLASGFIIVLLAFRLTSDLLVR